MEKYGIRLKSDLVFMRKKIKRKENFQIYFETEHLPLLTKNGSSVPCYGKKLIVMASKQNVSLKDIATPIFRF